ncbi:MAG: hypothetical protein GY742_10585 [Hyphomicrobiales bacterium]|nr:hypothetical protein [Hyphomicrobiales bacterium]
MKRNLVTFFLVICLTARTVAVMANDVGVCYPPVDPFPDKLSKSDPLYQTALEEHQRHLEDMEDYVNCLDRERAVAFSQLKTSFDLFLDNFGEDAVLKYAVKKKAGD